MARLEFIIKDFVAILKLDFTIKKTVINKPFTKFNITLLVNNFNKNDSKLITITLFKESFNTFEAKIIVNSRRFIEFMVFTWIKYHFIRNLKGFVYWVIQFIAHR